MNTSISHQKSFAPDTEKQIINTARRLFSEYSYLGVSMNDIAKKLNITKAALYYHFTGKAEIYKKVLDGVFEGITSFVGAALAEKTLDKKMHRIIKDYLDFGLKEKNLIKAVMLKLPSSDSQITKHVTKLREGVANLIQPVIEEILVHKKLTKKVDGKLLTSLLTSMMDGLLLEYSFLNKKINTVEISNQIIALLF